MKNFIKDFSSWQTVQGEKNRQIRDLDSRISELESQHEDLDLESLEGRGQIAISDIVTLMKQMQIDILKKCATTTEILSLRTEIKDIEENSNKILQHHMKTNKMAETVDNMNVIAAKIKDMQMDSMRNQNRILENNRRLEDTLSRINNLENIHRKGTKLENALANAANLDGRQIIEAVLEVTSEIQVNMVHKDEFLDLRAETGDILTSLQNNNVKFEQMQQQQTDDHYGMVANTQRNEDMLVMIEQMKADLTKLEMKVSQKLDIELFDEEIQIMRGAVNARVSTPATGHGEAIDPRIVTNRRSSFNPKHETSGVRMSVADKTKIKDMQE